MIVAQKKRKENIAEYILYMWQVEDAIRALHFDHDQIKTILIDHYDVDDQKKIELENWYKNLTLMMGKEQIKETGHLQFLINLVDELNQFHLLLLEKDINARYTSNFAQIKDDIELLRQKSKQNHSDVEVALNALYILLMLKMKNKEISEGTQQAVWKLGNFMGLLSALYRKYEEGELDIYKEQTIQ